MSISKKIGDVTEEVYEKVLLNQIRKSGAVPSHIGIITDGNRRYARERGISPNEGHVKGKEKLEEVLEWCMEIGTSAVTIYGFSTENFMRNPEEVEFLLHLIDDSLNALMKDERVSKNRIRVKVIGELKLLPDFLRNTIEKVQKGTEAYGDFKLNLAIGYGGREEIINAVKKIADEVKMGKISTDDINEDLFHSYLYDSSVPDPDLIFRTSGEERISNFLLWQGAYSELYFSDINWPDLRKIDFLRAVYTYQGRKRRFGT